MADVNVSLGVTGKDAVLAGFKEVGTAGKELGEALWEHTKKLGEMYLGYESLVKVMETFHKALEKGGALADLSEQTGISAGKLVILQKAFENNGMQAEELGKTVNKMQKFIEGAGEAGSEAAQKLARIGLFASDLKQMTPEEQFQAIGKALAAIDDPTEKAAAAMEIFGKAGGRTLALFANFGEAVETAKGQVGSLADQMENQAETFHDVEIAFKEIGEKATEFATGILQEVAPALKEVADLAANFNATGFGQGFSKGFLTAIDVGLSVFRDPGNLFLAFGEALLFAFRKAANGLMDGLKYAIEFGVNFFGELAKTGIIDLVKNGMEGAFHFAVSGFTSVMAESIEYIAGFLPKKWGAPMQKAASALREQSEKSAEIFEGDLAKNATAIAGAFEKARANTELTSEDYFGAAESGERLKEYIDKAKESGSSIREALAASAQHTREMAEMAQIMAKAGGDFADRLSGGAQTFKQFTANGGPDFGKLAGLSSPQAPAAPAGPINDGRKDAFAGKTNAPVANSITDRSILPDFSLNTGLFKNTSGLAMPMQEELTAASMSLTQGSAFKGLDQRIQQAQSGGNFTQAASLMAEKANKQKEGATSALNSAAENQTTRDYASKFGLDENASKGDILDSIKGKYSPGDADRDKKAEEEFNAAVAKRKGPMADGGKGGGGPGGEGQKESPESILTKILGALTKDQGFLKELTSKLPQPALT